MFEVDSFKIDNNRKNESTSNMTFLPRAGKLCMGHTEVKEKPR